MQRAPYLIPLHIKMIVAFAKLQNLDQIPREMAKMACLAQSKVGSYPISLSVSYRTYLTRHGPRQGI